MLLGFQAGLFGGSGPMVSRRLKKPADFASIHENFDCPNLTRSTNCLQVCSLDANTNTGVSKFIFDKNLNKKLPELSVFNLETNSSKTLIKPAHLGGAKFNKFYI